MQVWRVCPKIDRSLGRHDVVSHVEMSLRERFGALISKHASYSVMVPGGTGVVSPMWTKFVNSARMLLRAGVKQ